MGTRGIAHHQRGTFPVLDTDAESAQRRARYAEKDAAYRAALRLGDSDPLPAILGRVSSSGAGYTRSAAGGRIRRTLVVN